MDERIRLESQLHGAISRGEFTIHYQPEFDLASGRLVRFEALARWAHPNGMIPPIKFIPIAEETGLIIPLGEWVMGKACLEAVGWQQWSKHPVQVAVNVSAIEFSQEDFMERVLRTIRDTGLKPELLQIELTESVAVAGFEEPAAKMAALQELGIGVALDDFGTGYSAMSYLRRLPCDCLKIDRSFVTGLAEKEDSIKILQSMVGLAHSLDMTAIVEGIETPEQLSLLRQLGCDQAQGYLLGKPAPNPRLYLVDGKGGVPDGFIMQRPASAPTAGEAAST
jgi:EAL domain-containing protein (putative c-di-GMP-specific phosphodiesterase class I)